MRFTKPAIGALTIPADKNELIVFDDALPGFGLRMRAGGSKSWIAQYRIGSKQRRVKIGTFQQLELEKARDAARSVLAQAVLGDDAAQKKITARARASLTLDGVIKKYLASRERQMKPRSFIETKRHLTKDWKPLHGVAVHEIKRADVASRLSEIAERSGLIAADRARASLSACLSWTIREGIIESNPVIGTNRHAGKVERDRVLSDFELSAIWHACRDDDHGRIVRLLMLLPARRAEIGSLVWSELDLEKRLWSLPANRSKNGRASSLPLTDEAMRILLSCPRRSDNDHVFGKRSGGYSGWSKSKAALDARLIRKLRSAKPKAALAERWTLHDIRRTAATRMADLGVQPHIIETLLNHASGHKAGVAGVYNRANYEREKLVALEVWAAHLSSIIQQSPAKVLPIRAGASR